ncbi:adenine-specific DNA-methyltransferase [Enhydrobacter aerosaccus]|uniref:site-specific DNA-methyltransferase (adenine-specific) n=1 Tax=Enhydrobacter aerosaccus TaxID=225324 RepID=A0A1T4JL95_9HYPH|nr:adenine-specific DNA-methyltransferase [Enhydrobacter aerosaccus]
MTHGAALNRRVSDLRRIAARLKRTKMSPLQVCEAIIEGRLVERGVRSFFAGLPNAERHYWIASLYTLLMPQARRRKLAAYFTPPHLARYAIEMLVASGIRLGEHRILDPASGGAAFLVPLATQIAEKGRRRGEPTRKILHSITSTLHGIEIDPGLGSLSQALLNDLFKAEVQSTKANFSALVETADTLSLDAPEELYDAVIGNPPYGRIFRPTRKLKKQYDAVISEGYVNLYALFVEQALRWVRPGGIVCLIIPISFVGGPYFAALRQRILQGASVLRIDLIDQRSDVFLDVLHDLSVVVLRRHNGSAEAGSPQSALLLVNEDRPLGTIELPTKATRDVWALPDGEDRAPVFQTGLSTLADYGYIAKTGYFVWNREQHRYRVGKKPRPTEIPLFWAHNVRANKPCLPQAEDGEEIVFAKIPHDCPGIIRSDAIILQRTSNRRQKRRLIAGTVRHDDIIGGRGFITENHTIVILPDPSKDQLLSPKKLCRLLNTSAVDARFRRMSGSVSISTKALRQLPLPSPHDIKTLLRATERTDDEAAVAAYAASVRRSKDSTRDTPTIISKGRRG